MNKTLSLLLLPWLVLLCTRMVAARMVYLSPDLLERLHQVQAAQQQQQQLDAVLKKQLTECTRQGTFPVAGRTLAQKVEEAQTFLDRELGNGEVVGTGVTIVYEDKVVFSKGYGLKKYGDSQSTVKDTTLFQIGSLSKTFVTLAIATLVDDGKFQWTDPVKMHLPSLQLYDKYAEEHVTIGDLLAMNSGFGAILDLGWGAGIYKNDSDLVAHLKFAKPQHSLREQYDYANVNFAILGQLIEAVTGQCWDAYLAQRIWRPLGMTRTFAAASVAEGDPDMSSGHFVCGKDVRGPYNLITAPEVQLLPGVQGGKLAAGSIVSCAADMAKMVRLMLNKTHVDNVQIFKSTSLVSTMITGKVPLSAQIRAIIGAGGQEIDTDGSTLAAGYGLDVVGHVMWGKAYYEKLGDTASHQTRSGFAPAQRLGMVFMANSQLPEGHMSHFVDHLRSYVMGIFLDVPKDLLDYSYRQWRNADRLQPQPFGVPLCGPRFMDPRPAPASLDEHVRKAMTGMYIPEESPEYYGQAQILEVNGTLALHVGAITAPLDPIATEGKNTWVFRWSDTNIVAIARMDDGKFMIDFGLSYRQQ
ncbi:TPA: hypothetical protein N0F65_001312 [Lagenidium giganteum]|uniref:Beta-lactamase-related domain-containing protein n=1 Tax=Lagenidium giganteum TaxID=4803 RepID=A0AAV2Z320_9STRA|nr:TPA: hypothetical protein N0F65_001312 [Lagenidium giganteum]